MDAKMRDTLLGTIEHYLEYLALSRSDPRFAQRGTPDMRFGLDIFKNAEIFQDGVIDHTEELVEGKRAYSWQADYNPMHFHAPFNTTFIVSNKDDTAAALARGVSFREGFALRRFRSVPAAETRGRIKPWVPYVIEEHTARIHNEGGCETSHMYYGYVGNIWKQVHAAMEIDSPQSTPAVISCTFGLINEHQIWREMLWHVSIGYAGTKSSLLIPCDAPAALELFKFRDLPEGAKRRAALLHWVQSHWRSVPTSQDDAARVVAHIKGRERFTWTNGLTVEIRPSAEDLRRIKKNSTYARKHPDAVNSAYLTKS